MSHKTVSTRKAWAEAHGHYVHFVHRDQMARKRPMAKATMPGAEKAVPPTTLPVDCTGNGTVSAPMDDNDKLGICGLAMCDHVNNIRTYGQGKPGFTEMHANLAALDAQYEKVSGGDNGTDEDMLVGSVGVWTAAGGGLAGDPTAIVVDHLDVDITDVPLTQYCIDQFYHVNMAWSVPDAFLQQFVGGSVFASAMTPNPANGHFTAQSDVAAPGTIVNGVDIGGFYRIFTWGAWCWASPSMIASVQPQCFVTFSPLQFKAVDGYDSHGRHVSDVGAAWIAIGGNASIVASVVAQFPGKVAPPAPAPQPTPPSTTGTATYEQAAAWVADGINAAPDELQDKEQAVANALAGLAKGFGVPGGDIMKVVIGHLFAAVVLAGCNGCQPTSSPTPTVAPSTARTDEAVYGDLVANRCLAASDGGLAAVAAEHATGRDVWLNCMYQPDATIQLCAVPCAQPTK